MPDSKTILITGSSRGIGAALAPHFLGQGDRVILNYARSADEANALYEDLTTRFDPESVTLIQADVSDRAQVESLFRQANEQMGSVNVLINNAGRNIDGPFLEMTDTQWDSVLATNLTGAFICTQEFVFQLHEQAGQVINMAASTGIHGRKNGVNYCSAKAGLITLTKCLALELAPRIAVNCVMPGHINTEEVMTRFNLHDEAAYREALDTIPQDRLGITDDVCATVDFLVHHATFMTGQNLLVNGGQYMH
ncbi:MAG: SDR family NAD(P)-dependent oxidoreductase [Planctomycetes bacterium]|nr:SDR family NAD(P)-dependent oxidoreductase [Planctomycetota bacterium]